jgi:uncharacterized membrane protein
VTPSEVDMVLKLISKIDKLYFASGLYVLISIILGAYLLNGLVLFLGWNMILATVVFFLSRLLIYLDQRKVHCVFLWMTFGFWILFFPNSFYILTDFIHLEVYDFFIDYPSIYTLKIDDWLVMAHITIGALIALKLGLSSITLLEEHFLQKLKLKPYKILILTALFLVSSIGIYIGRFLRFNSWDILRLFQIVQELFEEWQFMMGFILVFTIIHWVSYLLFANRTNNVV